MPVQRHRLSGALGAREWVLCYAAADRLGKVFGETSRGLASSNAPIPPPPGADAATWQEHGKLGENGRYFSDKSTFYKSPRGRAANSVNSEVNASKALRHLGIPALPVQSIQHAGTTFLKYPKLVGQKQLDDKNVGEYTPHSQNDLQRLTLGHLLIHAGDRHLGNTVVVPGKPNPLTVDYGKSFSVYNSPGGAGVGHKYDEYVNRHLSHDAPLDKGILADVINKADTDQFRSFIEGGVSGHDQSKKDEAHSVFNEKIGILRDLLNHPDPRVKHLPTYFGMKREQPNELGEYHQGEKKV